MKFHINKDEFLKALIVADSIINTRTPLSILLNVYLEVHSDGQVILQSYSGEYGVKVELIATVIEAGKISLSSKKILEIVRNIPSDIVCIQQEKDQLELVIHPEAKKNPVFRLNAVSADTYPTFKEFSWDNYVRLNQNILKELIVSTEFSVSHDISQVAFTGTFVTEIAEGLLTFVATDGKRLAVVTKSFEERSGTFDMNVIIPQRILKIVCDTLTQGDVLFAIDNGQVYFKIDDVYIFSNLVEGKFPSYRDVIPAQSQTTLAVDASALASCIHHVSVMSDVESGRVTLQVHDLQLSVSGNTMQGESNDFVDIENIDGAESVPSISLNHKSLTDFLKVVQGKKILISINSATSPILLTPSGASDYEYIIMPMKNS